MGVKQTRARRPEIPKSLLRELENNTPTSSKNCKKRDNTCFPGRAGRRRRHNDRSQAQASLSSDDEEEDPDNILQSYSGNIEPRKFKKVGAESDIESGNDDGMAQDEDEEIDSDEAFDSDDEKRFEGWRFASSNRSKSSRKAGKLNSDGHEFKDNKNSSCNHAKSDQDSEENTDDDQQSENQSEWVDLSTALDQQWTDSDDGSSEANSNDFNDSACRRHAHRSGRGTNDEDQQAGRDNEYHSESSEFCGINDETIGLSNKDNDSVTQKVKLDKDLPDSLDFEASSSCSDNLYDSFGENFDDESEENDGDNKSHRNEIESETLLKFVDMLENKKRPVNEMKGTRTSSTDHLVHESEYTHLPSAAARSLNIDEMVQSLSSNQSILETLRDLQTEPSSKYRKLEPALPRRAQERLDRTAAREITSKEIKKWEDTIKTNRQADHLQFPLSEEPVSVVNSHSLVVDFKHKSSLEANVNKLLETAGIKFDKDIENMEELEMNHLTIDQLRRRRDELRYSRELMFRHEIKAKRAAKIKSKTYRKIMRKEKLRTRMALNNEKDIDEEQLQEERQRAVDRMTQRHRNSARNLQSLREKTDLTRLEIEEQLDQEEQLENLIKGRDSEEEETNVDELPDDEIKFPEKGLLSMKFMKNAIRAKIKAMDIAADSESITVENDDAKGGKGRRIFKPRVKSPAAKVPFKEIFPTSFSKTIDNVFSLGKNILVNRQIHENQVDDENLTPSAASSKPSGTENGQRVIIMGPEPENNDKENPWLDAVESQPRAALLSEKMNKAEIQALKLHNQRRRALCNGDEPDIDLKILDEAISVPSNIENSLIAATSIRPSKNNKSISLVNENHNDEKGSDSNSSDVDDTSIQLMRKNQHELVHEAFAGDNVFREFQEEREAIARAEAPRTENMNLPGWGSWVGSGVKKKRKQEKLKQIPGIEVAKRKDAKQPRLIVNEKRMKKAEQLMSDAVPFPFENREQYDLAMRHPVGPEWNTRRMFSKAILPRVIAKQGRVIEPIQKV